MDAAPSQTSFGASVISGAKPLASLDRVLSKGRVLHRNLNPRSFASASARDLAEVAGGLSPTRLSPTAAADKRAGRAKRVVSRVIQNLAPGNARHRRAAADPSRPYMAGRFATTDTAVGNYAKEIFEFDDRRSRGNTLESVDAADPQQSRVRSIVYSGPMIKHATGGVSVTFTSQEVHDLELGTDAAIPEEDAEAVAAADGDVEQGAGPAAAAAARRSSSSPGAKRTRAMMHVPLASGGSDTEMADGANESEHDGGSAGAAAAEDDDEYVSEGSADELPTPPPGRAAVVSSSMPVDPQPAGLIGISSAASLQSTVKKKRRLHAGRTVVDVAEDAVVDNRLARRTSLARAGEAAAGAWASSPALAALDPLAAQPRVARAALPQESKQPVLFTPVRTRSGNRLDDASPTEPIPKQDSIFTTPMKMLSRLRNRKK
ncbi:hypothetical protein H4R21_003930 [Coemansia helicoidea]|uniref:Uncharacterized protein n=1 Tax=Coemansia helicoidea TaxID=1286919 RepID=A0ACC1L0Y6_9FUNG|nr:hypothetical protein H4R21_003930 [Coemansia helicoidea]